VVLDFVLIGLAITLQPVSLTAFLLVLASERGVRKGAAFVFGWLLSLAAVIALTVLATGNKPPEPRTAPSTAVLAVKIAIGTGLLLVALRQRRRMGRPKKTRKTPKWQARIDKMSPWYAVVIAAIVQPWPLAAAATAIVVEAKLSSAATYISLGIWLIGKNCYTLAT
jgi:Sap, sulfolipid-1-addressing protein